jgi:hypothetical protein
VLRAADSGSRDTVERKLDEWAGRMAEFNG